MIPRENQRGGSWIYLVLALLLASATALAGTTGNLTGYVKGPSGQALPGVKVSVTAPVLQGEKSTTTDARGFWRVTQLPPGDRYRVRFESTGFKTTERAGIVLHIDETIKIPTVRMSTQQTEDVIEVITEAPVVDQGSTSVGKTLSNEFLSVVPTGRNTTAILQLAPGAATDSIGTTFRGASSPENNYVVDGLNTTGILTGLDSSSLPPEFIQEIQVKTGGYEPEYGRATGGQSLIITKSGGNEFHGDVFMYLTPIEGRRHTVVAGDNEGTVKLPNEDEVAAAARVYNMKQNLIAQIGFDIGGYIIKDRLWFFAGYAPEFRQRTYGHEFLTLQDDDVDPVLPDPDLTDNAVYDTQNRLTNFYILNFTYNINQNHSLRLSASGNPAVLDGVASTAFNSPSRYMGSLSYGATDVSLNYHGQFMGGLANLDAMLGYHTENTWSTPFQGVYNSKSGNSLYEGNTLDGSQATYRYNYYVPVEGGCNEPGGSTTDCGYYGYTRGGAGYIERMKAGRLVFKPVLSLFVNNLVGNHVFKIGGDFEQNKVVNMRSYSGGGFTDIYDRGAYILRRERYLSNFEQPTIWSGDDPLNDEASYFKATSNTVNTSAFIQDSWSVLSNLSISLGVRWERQQIKDNAGQTRIDLNNNIAPRFGVIYDFTNEGKSKLFANFGRYYESVPLDINDRALSAEGFNYYYYVEGFNDETYGFVPDGLRNPDVDCAKEDYDNGTSECVYKLVLGGEVTPVQADLKGQYSDQYLVGFEYEVMKDLSAGITGVYATLGNVIEDISPDNGNTYIIANPGTQEFEMLVVEPDATTGELGPSEIATDEDGKALLFKQCISTMDPLTGAPTTYCFPKAERYYRGVELVLNKRFSDNWTGLFSYTWSQSYGNYPGLFAQSRGQLDPNITSQFDLPNLLTNRYGYLDTDRTHLIKFSGAYLTNIGTAIGLTANIQSGIPILYLGAHPWYGGGEAFVVPRATVPEDAVEDVPARTPWLLDIDASVHHTFTFANKNKLSLGFQLNNAINRQSHLLVSQLFTSDYAAPASGGTSTSQTQCFDSNYGNPSPECEIRQQFGTPTSYQSPMSIRLEAKYSF